MRGPPVRWYTIDRSYRPGLPPIHVVSEIVGYVDRGRAWPAPLTDPEALTREELCSIPGGADALARWEARDDSAYQALMDAMAEEADAEAAEAVEVARRVLRSV